MSVRRLSSWSSSIAFVVLAACSSKSGTPASDEPSPTGESAPSDPAAPGPGGTSGGPGGGSSGGSGGEPEPSGPPQVSFVGRMDTSDPAGPKATWPGTRILTRFEGTRVSVKMSEYAEYWMEGAPSYWELSIDKGPWTVIPMIADNTPHDFELAKDLPPGEHTVELYKRSEMQTGITQFLGFDFHGGKALPPPPRQERKIEVMGDSQTTGYGVEMTDAPETDCPGVDYSGKYQNFRKSWGAVLGRRFDAEVHGIAYSGKGVTKNIWPTDTDPLVRYYPRANPNPAMQNSNPPLFDLKSWVPDVIVLAQGAMDFNAGVDYGTFRTAYRDFVMKTLRGRSESTHIIMATFQKGGREAIQQIASEIIAERKAAGDERMHLFVGNLYTWDEMTGCLGHGTPAWHERIANELATFITAKVGWQ